MLMRRDPEWSGVFYVGNLRVLLKFMHWTHLTTRRVLRFGLQWGGAVDRVVDLPLVQLSWPNK